MYGLAVIAGTSYPHSLYFNEGSTFSQSTDFSLNRQYQAFRAILGVQDGNRWTVIFEVYLDGSRVFVQDIDSGKAWPISIPVTGAGKLTLKVSAAEEPRCCPSTIPIWGNAQLIGS